MIDRALHAVRVVCAAGVILMAASAAWKGAKLGAKGIGKAGSVGMSAAESVGMTCVHIQLHGEQWQSTKIRAKDLSGAQVYGDKG